MDIERKAERARALLNDDLLQEVIAEIQGDAQAALLACDPLDVDGLRKAALAYQAAQQFTQALWHRVQTLEIEQKKKGRDRGKHD